MYALIHDINCEACSQTHLVAIEGGSVTLIRSTPVTFRCNVKKSEVQFSLVQGKVYEDVDVLPENALIGTQSR